MSAVTLKQLRALTAIGSHRKIVGAAKALNLTPPAVTQQLQQLEAETGCILFDRTGEGLRPTEAGQIMLETAAQIWSLLDAGEERLAALKGMKAGRVTLGVVSTAKYFAPRLLSAFAKDHPGVEVRLLVDNREGIVDLLRGFQIDLAIMGAPPKELRAEALLLGDHPLVIIAPPEHPLAGRRDIRKAELAGEVFLTREAGSGTRTSMEAYLGGFTPPSAYLRTEMGSNETIKQAVMAGLGIAFISAHTIAAELLAGRLVKLDVEGLPIRRQWFSVRHLERTAMPTTAAFIDFLRQQGRSYLPVV